MKGVEPCVVSLRCLGEAGEVIVSVIETKVTLLGVTKDLSFLYVEIVERRI